MQNIFSHKPNDALTQAELETLKSTEWLVTNGLGGYASGTIGGSLTRVFHGYLISALPSPFGRTMMLNQILEQVVLPDGRTIQLNGVERDMFEKSVTAVQSLVDACRKIAPDLGK